LGRLRGLGKMGGLGRLGGLRGLGKWEVGRVGRNGDAEIINKFFWTLTYFLYFCRRLIRGAVIG